MEFDHLIASATTGPHGWSLSQTESVPFCEMRTRKFTSWRLSTKKSVLDTYRICWSDFTVRLAAISQSVLNMPDLRRNGYLNMLIPYLHIFSFVLGQTAPVGFLVSDPARPVPSGLPRGPPVWRFRLVNEDALPWGDYQAERFFLPMHPQVELRTPLVS
jgi:hypothetical protein